MYVIHSTVINIITVLRNIQNICEDIEINVESRVLIIMVPPLGRVQVFIYLQMLAPNVFENSYYVTILYFF